MNYKRSTSTWRDRHAQASEHLRQDREAFFADPGNIKEIVSRLRSGKTKALRELAREIQARGIYSRKIPLVQVEQMMMSRLHASYAPQTRWQEFVRSTVGLGWIRGEERRAA